MRYKALAILLQFSLAALLILSFSNGGIVSLQENYGWIILVIGMVLTLPSLISIVIFNKSFFGFTTAFSFLIYPILFFGVIILGQITKQDTTLIGNTIFLLLVIFWNILLVSVKVNINKENTFLRIIIRTSLLLIGSLALIMSISIVRPSGSILALDYMQHQAVINQSIALDRVCLTPSACSNIFLQNGYTTIYHSVLSFITSFSGNNLEKTIYSLDLVWAVFGFVIVFILLKNLFKRTDLAALGAIIASLVFVNGAYEFNFFIPQTFAFFLFLNFILSKQMTWKKIAAAVILLILTHFIMGAVLAFILVLKFLIVDQGFLGIEHKGNFRITVLFVALISVFTILLNLAGFSFENSFQSNEVAYVGSSTNLIPPGNYSFVLNLLGTGVILLLIAVIFFFVQKQHKALVSFAAIYLLINLSLFFISPTYSNKFMIGFGIFSAILIINYLKDLKLNTQKFALLTICLFIVFLQPFITNFKSYLLFYTQSDGTISAVNKRDLDFLDKLKDLDTNCTIISDPLTQSLITGYTKFTTVTGQYMSLETRRSLLSFITEPTIDKLTKIKSIALNADKEKEACFLYTSRLEIGVRPENLNWANNVYILPINNNASISNVNIQNVILQSRGTYIYSDNYYQLFKL